MKYIIDTDPGIDDAIAIMMAIKNNLDVVSFSLATGNIPLEKSENNLKIIEDFLNINIPIYKGTTINKCSYAPFAHGIDGLGYAVFPKQKTRVIEKLPAEDMIIKLSKKYKDDLTIICLGPLTNIANALKKDPTLENRLKHLVVMGTSYNPKSKKPYIEFNISVDKKSADIVFNSNIEDIKVITHEIGVKSYIPTSYINKLKDSDDIISRFIYNISLKYIEFSYKHYHTKGLGTPDPTTVASVINDKIISYIPCSIKINRKCECIITEKEKSNILIANNFNLNEFRKLFKNTFK